MELFSVFIYSIILTKLTYLFFLIRYFYYKYKYNKNPEDIVYYHEYKNTENIKSKLEIVITFLMATLLILLFYPHKTTKTLDSETKQLLCIFGIILIIKEIGFLV